METFRIGEKVKFEGVGEIEGIEKQRYLAAGKEGVNVSIRIWLSEDKYHETVISLPIEMVAHMEPTPFERVEEFAE